MGIGFPLHCPRHVYVREKDEDAHLEIQKMMTAVTTLNQSETDINILLLNGRGGKGGDLQAEEMRSERLQSRRKGVREPL